MTCCGVFFKVINGIFAVYFTIVSLALMGYGAFSTYTILVINNEDIIKNHLTILPSAVTFILGTLLILLIIIGCCAIFREISCCMESYSTMLIILALMHFALGAYCIITYQNRAKEMDLRNRINYDISYKIDHYRENPGPMDDIQRLLACCGKDNALNDYPFYEPELPPSCCEDSITCLRHSPLRYRDGCARQVFLFTWTTNYFLGWISIIVAVTELLAGIFGICLSCCIWRHQSGVVYTYS